MNAPCQYYPKCGGCQLQHLEEEAYRRQKSEMLTNLFPDQPIHFLWGKPASRRRAEFKIDGSGHMGFFAPQSHDVVAIEHCLAMVPEIDALILPLQQLARSIRPEKILVTKADNGLEILITARKEPPLAILKQFAEEQDIGRVVLNDIPVLIRCNLQMQFSGAWVDMPPGAFLQPTVEGQQLITETVDRMIPKAKKIAEFFCGMGTYSFLLAKKAPVIAYEMSEKAVAVLKNHPRITAVVRDIEKFPVQPQEIAGADVAVLNPPRNGAAPQCKALARAADIKRIVMISCHPRTLNRDIGILLQAGFVMKEMVAVDQFHWTHHLETVCLLERI